jgi:hypothetical protein
MNDDAASREGFYVTLIRYVAHAAGTEDALMAAVKGAGKLVAVDVQAADGEPAALLTAQDVPR